jgi:hypothetical protein
MDKSFQNTFTGASQEAALGYCLEAYTSLVAAVSGTQLTL